MSHTWSKPIPRVRLRVIAIGKLGQVGRRVTCTSLSGHVYEADLPAQWFRASSGTSARLCAVCTVQILSRREPVSLRLDSRERVSL